MWQFFFLPEISLQFTVRYLCFMTKCGVGSTKSLRNILHFLQSEFSGDSPTKTNIL